MNFVGLNRPVRAGEALRYFFSVAPERFGPLDPARNLQQLLMDSLPLARQGYLLWGSAINLLRIYANANQLIRRERPYTIRSDELMNTAFNGNIPAAFYMYRDQNNARRKVPMEDAVEQGLIAGPMNTYQVISDLYPVGRLNARGQDMGFNPQEFISYYVSNIVSANTSRADDIINDRRYVDILAQILNESVIIENVLNMWDVLAHGVQPAQHGAPVRNGMGPAANGIDAQRGNILRTNGTGAQRWNIPRTNGINPQP